MGSEQGADFYDNRLERVLIPYEESPWKRIYDRVVDVLIRLCDHPKILDIGCGTGRLAEAIRRAGIRDYEGIDFSGERIKEARRYVPSMKFDIVDVFAEGAEERFRRYDTFIMTEFLEHITKDLDVIQQIPSGSRVIISVPNFDSAGHVRYFESEDEVIDRYSEYLHMAAEDTTEIRAPKRPEKITWVSHGIRR